VPKKKDRRKMKRKVAAARRARKAPAETLDKRGLSVEVKAMGGVPVTEPTDLIHIEPIRLESGEVLYFQAPFVVVFYLLKAKTLRDGAEPKRQNALAATKREADASLRPLHSASTFDALEDLALCAILAAAAIETHANDVIGRLPDGAMVETSERVAGKTITVMRGKAAMDSLRLADKVSKAAPILTGQKIKGTKAWQDFRRITRLRNALVHVKREARNDPDRPGPFGRLLLGEASTAPEDAAAVIEAVEPGWFPERVRGELGLP
jgi:hypothetical protein